MMAAAPGVPLDTARLFEALYSISTASADSQRCPEERQELISVQELEASTFRRDSPRSPEECMRHDGHQGA